MSCRTHCATIPRVLADLGQGGERRIWLLKYAHNLLPFRTSYAPDELLRLIAFQRAIESGDIDLDPPHLGVGGQQACSGV